jgi:GT2 family glycosyltransferase
MPLTYAVVPSLGRECLTRCLVSLLPQVEALFLVRTEEYEIPQLTQDEGLSRIVVIDDTEPPRNIQRWWNLGITAAAAYAKAFHQEEWDVLVVNDDVIACPQLARTLSGAMRATTAVLSYPDNFHDSRCVLHTDPGPVDLTTRISGWCFMIKGESGLKADEQFQWWYGDDDLDWRARSAGGALMVPGCAVEHLYPSKLTNESEELSRRTVIDRDLFNTKWSGVPH